MFFAMLLCSLAKADAPVIGDVVNGQQVCSAFLNAGDGTYWYWCLYSAVEGVHVYRSNAEFLPVLNQDNPEWQEIDVDAYGYELGEWGAFGPPATVHERAALTDMVAFAMFGGDFSIAYYYLGWSDDLASLQAESSL